jgi:hypothetical protein
MPENRITTFVTLNTVVKSFMNQRNEQGIVNFERYLQMAIEGFAEIKLFNLNSIEVAYLPVDPDTKIAKLPSDFLQMTKIGINVCGKIWTLTLNNDIAIPRPETICAATPDTCDSYSDSVVGGYYFADHFRNGQYISALFGLGGGFNEAYYKIDEDNGRILFDGCIRNDEVVLEYISSGVKAGGTPINRKAVPAIRAYLHWVTAEYDNRIPMNEKIRKEQLYNQELMALTRLENSFTYDEFLDSYYSTLSQTIKR